MLLRLAEVQLERIYFPMKYERYLSILGYLLTFLALSFVLTCAYCSYIRSNEQKGTEVLHNDAFDDPEFELGDESSLLSRPHIIGSD